VAQRNRKARRNYAKRQRSVGLQTDARPILRAFAIRSPRGDDMPNDGCEAALMSGDQPAPAGFGQAGSGPVYILGFAMVANRISSTWRFCHTSPMKGPLYRDPSLSFPLGWGFLFEPCAEKIGDGGGPVGFGDTTPWACGRGAWTLPSEPSLFWFTRDPREANHYRFGSLVDLNPSHKSATMDRPSPKRPEPRHLEQTGGCLFSGNAGSSMAITPLPRQAGQSPPAGLDLRFLDDIFFPTGINRPVLPLRCVNGKKFHTVRAMVG
jgi:hypothetical protein